MARHRGARRASHAIEAMARGRRGAGPLPRGDGSVRLGEPLPGRRRGRRRAPRRGRATARSTPDGTGRLLADLARRTSHAARRARASQRRTGHAADRHRPTAARASSATARSARAAASALVARLRGPARSIGHGDRHRAREHVRPTARRIDPAARTLRAATAATTSTSSRSRRSTTPSTSPRRASSAGRHALRACSPASRTTRPGAARTVELGAARGRRATTALLLAAIVDGLGEFAYRNELDLSDVELVGRRPSARPRPGSPPPRGARSSRFGGGIDSIVTATAGAGPTDAALFVVGPRDDRFEAIERPAATDGPPGRPLRPRARRRRLARRARRLVRTATSR